jgi:F420-dependent oxidoreductase-like protein
MRLGLDVAQHHLTWDELRARVRRAEELGFDGAWVFDHFTALYGDPFGPCLEGWTLLAGLAAVTERIRLGTLVTGITYRHPSLLAAEAITVDQLSHGRLELAVGAAWHAAEHRRLGWDFPPARERVERLDEVIEVLRLLMTTDGATFPGRYYHLEDAFLHPRPVQQPHPPVWVGGIGRQLMLPLIARKADVWHGFGSVADLRERSLLIDEHAARAGRDPCEIMRATSLSISEQWSAVGRRAEELAQAGFGYVTVDWPREGLERLEEFARDVMPGIAAL